MDFKLVIAGFIFIGIAYLCSADVISSYIETDGAVFITSTIQDENRSYSASLVTTDETIVRKNQEIDDDVRSFITARSAGPMGIDEFSSTLDRSGDSSALCSLLNWNRGKVTHYQEIDTSGLMGGGAYTSSRELGVTGLTGNTELNGTGQITLSKRSYRNLTQKEREWIAGRMNISEHVTYGGDDE